MPLTLGTKIMPVGAINGSQDQHRAGKRFQVPALASCSSS